MSNPSIPTLLASARALDAASASGGVVAGAAAAVVAESGDYLKLRVQLSDAPVVMHDQTTVGAYGGALIATLPKGYLEIQSTVANLAVRKSTTANVGINADFDGDFAVGSVTASNNASLTSTEADMIASASTPQAVAGVTSAKGQNVTPSYRDNSAGTNGAIYLNFIVDDADQDITGGGACSLIATGEVTVTYRNRGK